MAGSVARPFRIFASGKFDEFKRDIPYATVAQAFQQLIQALLSKSEAELSRWRDALREALDPNGQLIVNLVPNLDLIIAEQPPAPELPPQEERGPSSSCSGDSSAFSRGRSTRWPCSWT